MKTRNIISALLFLIAAILPLLAWEYYNWRFDGMDPSGNEDTPVLISCILLMLLLVAAGAYMSDIEPPQS